MADLSALPNAGLSVAGGPLSRLARAQYAALVTMRWRVFVLGLHSIRGLLELGSSGIELMVFSFLGLGLGIGLGFASHAIATRAAWQYLPIEFWVVCFLWQMIPIALASFQDQFDMTSLLRFPVSFPSFFVLYVVFGLADVSTVLGALCCLGICVGLCSVRPEMLLFALPALAGFAVFNILLARAVLAWVDRWLAQRRTREIVSALFLLFVVSLQLLNPAVRQNHHEATRRAAHLASRPRQSVEMRLGEKIANVVQAWLPPGLAADTLQQSEQRKPAFAVASLGALGLYVMAIGGVLAVRLRAEFRGENLGEAPRVMKPETRAGGWLLDGAGPVAAVFEKELRTLFRSLPQLYALGVPVLMVFVIASLFRNGASALKHPFHLALPICVAYGLLGFTRVIYNNLGIEGTGIQLLFLSPTPIRTVMMAKNLFHASLYGVVALLAAVLAALRLGRPDGVVLAATLAWLVFALPANLAVGNVLSLTMPYRVNPGRITRQPGSQANALLGMLTQTIILGIGALVFALCMILDRLWLSVPALLVFAAGAVFAWTLVLHRCDRMASEQRELLISTLAKTD